MKNTYKIFYSLYFLMMLSLTGCYTVVWTPDAQLPSRESDSSGDGGYYNDYYYGDYYNYYDAPWWYNVNPPAYNNQPAYNRDTSRSMESLRNDNGGRGNTDRLGIPQAPPSTRSASGSGSGNNSSSTKSTEDTGSRSNSNSNNSNSGGDRSNSNNRNSNNDRNNNGRN